MSRITPVASESPRPRPLRIGIHVVVVLALAAAVLVTESAGLVPKLSTPKAGAIELCGIRACPNNPDAGTGDVITTEWYSDGTTWHPTVQQFGPPYGAYVGAEFAFGLRFVDDRGRATTATDVYAEAQAGCTIPAAPSGPDLLFVLRLKPSTEGYCVLYTGGTVHGHVVGRRYVIQTLDVPQKLSWLDKHATALPASGLGTLIDGQPTVLGVLSSAPAGLGPPLNVDVLDITLAASGQCTATKYLDAGSSTYFTITPTGPGTCHLHADSVSRMAGIGPGSLDADLPVYPKQNLVDWGGWVQWMDGYAPPVGLTFPASAPTTVGGGSAGGQVILNASGACTAAYDPTYANNENASRWLVTPTGIGDCNLQLTALVIRLDGGPTPAVNVTVPVVAPQAVNHPPVADFSVTQANAAAPSAVSVDGSASSDPDGDALTYWWDFGNGFSGSGVTASTAYTRAGTYSVTLTVLDPSGAPSTFTKQLTVTDPTPPLITHTITGTVGNDGWYTSDVGVAFTVTDLESDATTTNGCDGTTIATDTTETLVTCTATSAGGTASDTVAVKRDATPPALAPVVTPNAVPLGSAASAAPNATDATSGVATANCTTPDTTHAGPGSVTCTASDVAGNTASTTAGFSVADPSAPVITPTVTGTLGNNGWYTGNVQVAWTVVDPDSPVTSTSGCDATTVTTDTTGTTFTCTASSAGGTASKQVTIKRDATAPTLSPKVTPNPVTLGATAVAAPGAADVLSGIATQSCGKPGTTNVGNATVMCTATDKAGNTATASAPYRVLYPWKGFEWPINAEPVVNKMPAGLGAPIVFSLGGNRGLDVLAGTPTSSPVACPRSSTVNVGLTLPTWVPSGLVRLGNDYVYSWKTDKTWKGTCRELTLSLRDGTTHSVLFKFS